MAGPLFLFLTLGRAAQSACRSPLRSCDILCASLRSWSIVYLHPKNLPPPCPLALSHRPCQPVPTSLTLRVRAPDSVLVTDDYHVQPCRSSRSPPNLGSRGGIPAKLRLRLRALAAIDYLLVKRNLNHQALHASRTCPCYLSSCRSFISRSINPYTLRLRWPTGLGPVEKV